MRSPESRPDTRIKAGRERGQALVELTMVTPLLVLLTILSVNFGGWLYSWTEIGNAARAVANYAVLGPNSAGLPHAPNSTAITSLIATDLAKLPNYSSSNPAVVVCQNQNGTITSIVGTCSGLSPAAVADPEASSYSAVSVDLTFTYTPFFSSFTFANFGVHLVTLPGTIHRRVVMRYI